MEGNDSSGGSSPESTGEQSTLSESANGDSDEQGDDVDEVLQPEEIEQANLAQSRPSSDLEELATYGTAQNGVKYKIIPQFTGTGSRWELWVFLPGSQGPALRTSRGITDSQAENLGLSRRLQDQLNTALEQANEELEIPAGFRGQSTNKRSLNDLEEVLGN